MTGQGRYDLQDASLHPSEQSHMDAILASMHVDNRKPEVLFAVVLHNAITHTQILPRQPYLATWQECLRSFVLGALQATGNRT